MKTCEDFAFRQQVAAASIRQRVGRLAQFGEVSREEVSRNECFPAARSTSVEVFRTAVEVV